MNLTPLEFAGLYAAGIVLVYGLLCLATWMMKRRKP